MPLWSNFCLKEKFYASSDSLLAWPGPYRQEFTVRNRNSKGSYKAGGGGFMKVQIICKRRRSVFWSIMSPPHPSPWRNSPSSSPYYTGFTMTPRHTTLGRTPLAWWSARCRNLCLTTLNIHKRQASMPQRDSNSQSQQTRAENPLLRPWGHCDRQKQNNNSFWYFYFYLIFILRLSGHAF